MAERTENKHWVEDDKTAKMRIEQAKTLRKKVAKGSGLSFEAYLTPSLAEWVLGMVEEGDFFDPSEAIFVLMQEVKNLYDHDDLRAELFKRSMQKAMDDPRPPIPADEVFKRLKKKNKKPRPETAVWKKIDVQNQ
jgi:Arc/MetJ-type ribon-helix-helix transcriptional regulator